MRFLASSGARKFLAAGIAGARFLAKNSQSIQRGLNTINNYTQNRAVAEAASKIGVNPSVLRTASRGLTNVSNALAAAPAVATNIRQVGQGVITGSQPARQSLASLNAQANAR